MQTLRTPDDRFANLPDFPFAPHYAEIPDGEGGTLRAHHLDEGPADGAVILLMHGEPSWCYLYRKMIPSLVAAGHRVIAPDLIGFGRSDKPTEFADYTYARHVGWMAALLFDALDLTDITYFGQDWGGLIGLRLVTLAPERYARVIIGNTGLPEGGRLSDAFLAWQEFSKTAEAFDIGALVNAGCATPLTPEEIAAYDAPFPDDTFKAATRIMPSLVPLTDDDEAARDNKAAWAVLETFDRPFLCTFSDGDPFSPGGEKPFMRRVPGAAGQAHTTIVGASHFLQEDRADDVVHAILGLMEASS